MFDQYYRSFINIKLINKLKSIAHPTIKDILPPLTHKFWTIARIGCMWDNNSGEEKTIHHGPICFCNDLVMAMERLHRIDR